MKPAQAFIRHGPTSFKMDGGYHGPSRNSGRGHQTAASFVTLLGARAYFADLAEVDGIMASIHTLPTLAAVALTETVMGQPGWNDIRKLAGQSFLWPPCARSTGRKPQACRGRAKEPGDTVRVLDEYISALQSLRDEVNKEEKNNLQVRLKGVLNERAQWQRLRANSDWQSSEFPKQEILRSMTFGGGSWAWGSS